MRRLLSSFAVATSVLAVFVLEVAAPPAQGAVTLTADEELVIPAHEVIDDDLIVWADYVRVEGVVKGDLVAIGSEVVVEGIVEGDLVAAGKTVYLNGSVNDDARVLAYAVALGEKARVGDDLFDLSYSLEARPESSVGGTLYAASRQLLLAGQVVEDVLARAGALELRGLVGGDVRAVVGGLEGVTHSSLVIDLALEIPDVPEGVTLTDTAAVGGDLDYRSETLANVAPGARVAGETRHEAWRAGGVPSLQEPEDEGAPALGERGHDATQRLAALLVVGLVLAVAVPGWLRARGDRVRHEPVALLGWGIAAVVLTAVAGGLLAIAFGILLAISLATGFGGLALTAIIAGSLMGMSGAALFYLAFAHLAPVLASAGLGRAIVRRFRPVEIEAPEAARPGAALLTITLGAVTYTVLRAIPGLGFAFGVAAALVGLGALAVWLRDRFAADAV